MADVKNVNDGGDTSRKDTSSNRVADPLLQAAFSELEAAHEELLVAEEEMRTQNEALVATAQSLEAERSRYRDLFDASPEPSFITDLLGVIQEANPAAHTLLNVGIRFLIGRPLASYVARDSRRTFRAQMEGRTEVTECGLYLQPRNGPLVYATVRQSPILDANGKRICVRWQVRGTTEDPGGELDRYRQFVSEVRDFAIFTMDADTRIKTWNAGAEAIFGYTAAEAVGLSGAIIFTPEDRDADVPEHERAEAQAMGRAADERWHIRKDGTRLWASGVFISLRDPSGGRPWYAKIVRDLTDQHIRNMG